MDFDSESLCDENVFYFESDHLALKGNTDYQRALRHLASLEVLRTRLHQKLEALEQSKSHYLEKPEELINKLQNNKNIVDEKLIANEKIPELNFEDMLSKYKYRTVKEESGFSLEPPKVRGRIVDETKPETFNQLWTDEEQRRLEELLIEYPPEEKEMRRFTKIANALGNRTALQVASRVQKYFQKLHEAGLPVPGRIPKNRRPKPGNRLKNYQKPSTFFPQLNVPVHMPEDDYLFDETLRNTLDSPVPDVRNSETRMDINYDVVNEESKKLKNFILQKIRDEKMLYDDIEGDMASPQCDKCKIFAISRLNWNCLTCYSKLNFCSDCIVEQLITNQFDHLTHNVIAEKDIV